MSFVHDEDSSWDHISRTSNVPDESAWDLVSTVSDVESVVSFFPVSYRDVLLKKGQSPSFSIEEKFQELAGRGNSTKELSAVQSQSGHTSGFATLPTNTEHCETEKPMTDKLRRKHEKSGRRKCLRGHTGRFNFMSSSEIDEQCAEKLAVVPSFGANCDREVYLTALEIGMNRNGRDMAWNLNKDHAWDLVPAILKEEAFEQTDKRRLPATSRSESRPVSTFKLSVISTNIKGKEEAAFERDAERREYTIYVKPPCRPWVTSTNIQPKQIFAELTKETPAGIEGELLSWKLGQTNRRTCGRRLGRKQAPNLHGEFGLFVQDMPILNGRNAGHRRYVEVDMGQQRAVTAVSTQGGSPPVRRYPNFHDFYSLPNGESAQTWRRLYRGPFWKVYDPEMECEDPRKKQPQWVRSYELQWRATGGRSWESLGIFRGNTDTTTEKANSLVEFGREIYCRYLRIIPVSCEGNGALRLGVYGRVNKSEGGRQGSQSLSTSCPVNHVDYRLYHPSTLLAPNCDQRDCGSVKCRDDDKCSHKQRRDLRVQAKRANNGTEYR